MKISCRSSATCGQEYISNGTFLSPRLQHLTLWETHTKQKGTDNGGNIGGSNEETFDPRHDNLWQKPTKYSSRCTRTNKVMAVNMFDTVHANQFRRGTGGGSSDESLISVIPHVWGCGKRCRSHTCILEHFTGRICGSTATERVKSYKNNNVPCANSVCMLRH